MLHWAQIYSRFLLKSPLDNKKTQSYTFTFDQLINLYIYIIYLTIRYTGIICSRVHSLSVIQSRKFDLAFRHGRPDWTSTVLEFTRTLVEARSTTRYANQDLISSDSALTPYTTEPIHLPIDPVLLLPFFLPSWVISPPILQLWPML